MYSLNCNLFGCFQVLYQKIKGNDNITIELNQSRTYEIYLQNIHPIVVFPRVHTRKGKHITFMGKS